MLCKTTKKNIILGIFSIIVTSCLFGCNIKEIENTPSVKPTIVDTKSEILFSSSSSLFPLVKLIAEKYSLNNSDYSFKAKNSPSVDALNELNTGSSLCSFSDIYVYDALPPETVKEYNDTKFCVQGFAIIAHPSVTIDNLSRQQAIDIFTGRLTNWKKLTGENLPVTVVSRTKSSGSRIVFKKYALAGFNEIDKKNILAQTSQDAVNLVSQTPGSISYVSLTYALNNNSIKKLTFDGIEPTPDNIKAGKYPIWSYGHFYSRTNPSENISKFGDYLKGEDIKPLIKEMGYIPLSEMPVTR